MEFCPKCGTWVRPGFVSCPRCGYAVLYMNKDRILSFMERLLIKERSEERKRVLKDRVSAEVIDISGDIATLECAFPKFEEGDVVGYVTGEHTIEPLGAVIGGGRFLTISIYGQHRLEERLRIDLCEAEVLIGYDLQLDLVRRIRSGELDDLEKQAISCVFEGPIQRGIKSVELEDRRDIKGGFSLDNSQVRAVEAILGLEDYELLLIIGPPGTGKTRVIAKAAFELTRRGERILIASHTNRAVDNALEILPVEYALRVGRPEKVLPHIRPYLLSYKARTSLGKKLENLENEISKLKMEINELYKSKDEWYKIGHKEKYQQLKSELGRLKSRLRELCDERNTMLMEESERLVTEAKIIGSTLIKSQLPPLKEERFDIVLMDECSQASITLALLGMVKAKKWVLVGDHKQLLPIFQTLNIRDKETPKMLSAFCYMLNKYKDRALWLRWHYRSNSEIIGFSQKYVYKEEIKPVDSCKKIKLEIGKFPKDMSFIDPNLPIVFLHVEGKEVLEKDGSRFNESEVNAIRRIVFVLKGLGVKSEQIGVITPYRAQRNRIKEVLKDDDLEVNTVDSFQGREKDVIIFSITSTEDLDFVDDENRLNVAFTRARKKLIVVGNSKAISMRKKGTLHEFLTYVKERNSIFMA